MLISQLHEPKFVIIPHLPKVQRKKKTVSRYAVVQKTHSLDGAKVVAIIKRKKKKSRKFSLQVAMTLLPVVKLSLLEGKL